MLCDTGSHDGTINEARQFARKRGEPDKLIVGRFKWCNDFAAARNHAHSLVTGDVHAMIDLDERLIGGDNLRELASLLGERPELGAIAAVWSGPITPAAWGLRLFRAPVKWTGLTWEKPVNRGAPALMTDRIAGLPRSRITPIRSPQRRLKPRCSRTGRPSRLAVAAASIYPT